MPKLDPLKEERAALQVKVDDENFKAQRAESKKFEAEAEYTSPKQRKSAGFPSRKSWLISAEGAMTTTIMQ